MPVIHASHSRQSFTPVIHVLVWWSTAWCTPATRLLRGCYTAGTQELGPTQLEIDVIINAASVTSVTEGQQLSMRQV